MFDSDCICQQAAYTATTANMTDICCGWRLRERVAADLSAVGEVADARELLLVGGHEQLDGALADVQRRHVRQEVVAHEEAHEHCARHPPLCLSSSINQNIYNPPTAHSM